ncbi:MAG: hypothetical protein GY868_08755 [Deltaproteobacteria bacterium]|nr:hypothetical protein [Deltaproteobacteria bacterium]
MEQKIKTLEQSVRALQQQIDDLDQSYAFLLKIVETEADAGRMKLNPNGFHN